MKTDLGAKSKTIVEPEKLEHSVSVVRTPFRAKYSQNALHVGDAESSVSNSSGLSRATSKQKHNLSMLKELTVSQAEVESDLQSIVYQVVKFDDQSQLRREVKSNTPQCVLKADYMAS